MVAILFFARNCHNFITSTFSGNFIARTLQIAENFLPIATMKKNFDFYIVFLLLQKYLYDAPIYMLGIRIPDCLDPDLFVQIQILERALVVRSQLDSEL
jgi:hypothetical protein